MRTPDWQSDDGRIQLYCGDCLELLPKLEAGSVDAVVTDPPYGLSFMGKNWDHGIPGELFWREALRVAKPGAHMLAFGGTRTFHRLTCAIEDAGWEIRDCLMWVYGSGFPKSLNVSKAIDKAAGVEREVVGTAHRASGNNSYEKRPSRPDGLYASDDYDLTTPTTDAAKQWNGWGTALKPAWEPIIVAMKPLEGTFAQNALQHGVAGINIDGCRIVGGPSQGGAKSGGTALGQGSGWNSHNNRETAIDRSMAAGRWPANVIHDGSDEVLGLFPQTAPSPQSYIRTSRSVNQHAYGDGIGEHAGSLSLNYGDTGSAARFFYCAKASKADRSEGNTHPTVKPTALMRYLCRLITPPGGVVLDPFAGSFSTGKAAVLEGFKCIGVEREQQYFDIGKQRCIDELARPPLLEAV